MLPQMIGYAKHLKVMPFKISDNKLLKIIAKYGKDSEVIEYKI